MNGSPAPVATSGGGWLPSTLTEWVILTVVGCFIYMVKKQNDGILPALTDVTAAIKALPAAIKEAVREGVEAADRARDRAHEREAAPADRRA